MAMIRIKELQLPHGIHATNVWGTTKEQPGTVTVTLGLRGDGFGTAAESDRLDESTIHYGELAKRIRAGCHEGQTITDVFRNVHAVIKAMGSKQGGFIVDFSMVILTLPKASMYGQKVTFEHFSYYDENGDEKKGVEQGTEKLFTLHGMRCRLLLGVNTYERTNRQPVIATLDVWPPDFTQCCGEGERGTPRQLEDVLVGLLEATEYETLEALVEHALTGVKEHLPPGTSQVGLTLAKPLAVPFAEAPSVQVIRRLKGAGDAATQENDGLQVLNVIKPYMNPSRLQQ